MISQLDASCRRLSIADIIRAPKAAIYAVSRSIQKNACLIFIAVLSIAVWLWIKTLGRAYAVENDQRTHLNIESSVIQENERKIEELLEIARAEREADELKRSEIQERMRKSQMEFEDEMNRRFQITRTELQNNFHMNAKYLQE